MFLQTSKYIKIYNSNNSEILTSVSKFNVGLKSLLHQGLSEPGFYGDLVYKFKKRLWVGLIFLISFEK